MIDQKAYDAIRTRMARMQSNASSIEFHASEDWFLFSGMETRENERYEWDGLKRSGDPARPHMVFQITLAGRGALEVGGDKAGAAESYELKAGDAFAVLIPSSHRYYLPQGASWSFFWLTVQHPYVIGRLARVLRDSGSVMPVGPQSRLMARSIALWEEQLVGSDTLVREQGLFDWMFEVERLARGQRYPQVERDRWLQEVRHRIELTPGAPLDVSQLAATHGLSRSHYSHRFKAATGLSPAAWIAHVRLDEAARRLVRTDAKLESIARETGLGSANHMSKVFRRRFQLSPGEFRRQMR